MWPIELPFRLLISCRIFLCSLTLSNTSSFLTWSVQLISILLQHHISKLSRCFWSTARKHFFGSLKIKNKKTKVGNFLGKYGKECSSYSNINHFATQFFAGFTPDLFSNVSVTS
jgi:hypothetical protein